jgi:hypothetical protein
MAREDDYIEPIEEESKSDGLGTGLVVVTTLVLLAAYVIVEMALHEYGTKFLF